MATALRRRAHTNAEAPADEPVVPTRRASRITAKAVLALADAAAVALAMLAAYLLREAQGGHDIGGAKLQHLALSAVAVPIWVGLFARDRLYSSRFIVRRVDELRRIGRACFTAMLGLAAVGYVLQLAVSRAWLLASALFAFVFVAVEREGARRLFGQIRRSGRMLRPVVVVGSNDEARELAMMLLDDPTLGYRVVGFVDDHDHLDRGDLLGTLGETLEVVRRTGAGGVIVATSSTSVGVSNRLVRELLREGIHVELSSTLRDVAAERLTVRPLGRFPVVYLEPRHTAGWRSVAKRAFDLTLASLGLLAVAPLAALIAVLIKLDSRGPVIFKQTRIGQRGEAFEVRKFRTMCVDAEERKAELAGRNEADGPLFKMRDDPRVTRIGRFLRKTSLDELPQLLNVVRGEMSLVGPRPALPAELLSWDQQLHARLRVKPGITGMWQVNGRSDSSFESYSRLDLYYVDNWSLFTDLSILAKTVPTVLFGRGAY